MENKNKKYFLALALLFSGFLIANSQNPKTPTHLFGADILSFKPSQKVEIDLKTKGKPEWDILVNSSANVSNSGTNIFPKKIKITPDNIENLSAEIKAPETPGAYLETLTPLSKKNRWIRKDKINLSIVVDGDFSESYSFETPKNSETANLITNGTKDISLKIKNTGKVPWYSKGDFPLQLYPDAATSAPQFYDPETWISQKIAAKPLEDEIPPGETATFNFKLSAPSRPGDYTLGFTLAIKDIFTFPDQITLQANVNTKQVALTFDDGYGEIDPFINLLNEEGVRGTFFMLGCVAQQNPDAMRRIVNEGHLLASHSYCHPDFRTLSADQIRWQLNETRKIMQEITGSDVFPFFRYPYGAMNANTHAILDEEGWKYFHWTQSTGDYKHHGNSAAGRQQIYYYSTLNPPDKSIVLMHIISKSSLAVLPDIIKWYRDHGYTFVTVDEL